MYLVAGGSLGGDPESTEILVSGSSSWSLVGNLPVGLFDLRGVSLNNKVIMTGFYKQFGCMFKSQFYILLQVDYLAWHRITFSLTILPLTPGMKSEEW